MKKVSVIIPCYNAEEYIRRCMDSLLGQTIGVDNLEIIAVDDASTDRTLDLLLEYESRFPDSVIVIHCEENHRQGAARNLGLEYASADYIGYADADDWCEPDMYELMYERALKYDSDMVMCGYIREGGSGKADLSDFDASPEKSESFLEIDTRDKRSNLIALSGKIGLAAWTKLCKKSMLRENNIYFLEDTFYEDNFWASLLYLYAKKIVIMDKPLYHYFSNINKATLKQDVNRHMVLFDVCLLT